MRTTRSWLIGSIAAALLGPACTSTDPEEPSNEPAGEDGGEGGNAEGPGSHAGSGGSEEVSGGMGPAATGGTSDEGGGGAEPEVGGAGGSPTVGGGEARCIKFGAVREHPVEGAQSALPFAGSLYLQSQGGLRVFDISALPKITTGVVFPASGARGVSLFDGRLWTVVSNGIRIYDVSSPASPSLVGSITAATVASVVASGNHAAAFRNPLIPGTGTLGYLTLYDVSDPSNAVLLDELEWPFRWGAGAAFYGDYLYVTSQKALNAVGGTNSGLLQIFDVSEGELTLVKEYQQTAPIGQLAFIGDTGYAVSGGLRLFDATQPLNLVFSEPVPDIKLGSFRHSGDWLAVNSAAGVTLVDVQNPKAPKVGPLFSTISFPNDFAYFGYNDGIAVYSYENVDRTFLIPTLPCDD